MLHTVDQNDVVLEAAYSRSPLEAQQRLARNIGATCDDGEGLLTQQELERCLFHGLPRGAELDTAVPAAPVLAPEATGPSETTEAAPAVRASPLLTADSKEDPPAPCARRIVEAAARRFLRRVYAQYDRLGGPVPAVIGENATEHLTTLRLSSNTFEPLFRFLRENGDSALASALHMHPLVSGKYSYSEPPETRIRGASIGGATPPGASPSLGDAGDPFGGGQGHGGPSGKPRRKRGPRRGSRHAHRFERASLAGATTTPATPAGNPAGDSEEPSAPRIDGGEPQENKADGFPAPRMSNPRASGAGNAPTSSSWPTLGRSPGATASGDSSGTGGTQPSGGGGGGGPPSGGGGRRRGRNRSNSDSKPGKGGFRLGDDVDIRELTRQQETKVVRSADLEKLRLATSVLVAKACLDGSAQALMLAAHLVQSLSRDEDLDASSELSLPVGAFLALLLQSHVREPAREAEAPPSGRLAEAHLDVNPLEAYLTGFFLHSSEEAQREASEAALQAQAATIRRVAELKRELRIRLNTAKELNIVHQVTQLAREMEAQCGFVDAHDTGALYARKIKARAGCSKTLLDILAMAEGAMKERVARLAEEGEAHGEAHGAAVDEPLQEEMEVGDGDEEPAGSDDDAQADIVGDEPDDRAGGGAGFHGGPAGRRLRSGSSSSGHSSNSSSSSSSSSGSGSIRSRRRGRAHDVEHSDPSLPGGELTSAVAELGGLGLLTPEQLLSSEDVDAETHALEALGIADRIANLQRTSQMRLQARYAALAVASGDPSGLDAKGTAAETSDTTRALRVALDRARTAAGRLQQLLDATEEGKDRQIRSLAAEFRPYILAPRAGSASPYFPFTRRSLRDELMTCMEREARQRSDTPKNGGLHPLHQEPPELMEVPIHVVRTTLWMYVAAEAEKQLRKPMPMKSVRARAPPRPEGGAEGPSEADNGVSFAPRKELADTLVDAASAPLVSGLSVMLALGLEPASVGVSEAEADGGAEERPPLRLADVVSRSPLVRYEGHESQQLALDEARAARQPAAVIRALCRELAEPREHNRHNAYAAFAAGAVCNRHPLTVMLLQSWLQKSQRDSGAYRHIPSAYGDLRRAQHADSIFLACCALRVLEANLCVFYSEGLNPASVGLGILKKDAKAGGGGPRDAAFGGLGTVSAGGAGGPGSSGLLLHKLVHLVLALSGDAGDAEGVLGAPEGHGAALAPIGAPHEGLVPQPAYEALSREGETDVFHDGVAYDPLKHFQHLQRHHALRSWIAGLAYFYPLPNSRWLSLDHLLADVDLAESLRDGHAQRPGTSEEEAGTAIPPPSRAYATTSSRRWREIRVAALCTRLADSDFLWRVEDVEESLELVRSSGTPETCDLLGGLRGPGSDAMNSDDECADADASRRKMTVGSLQRHPDATPTPWRLLERLAQRVAGVALTLTSGAVEEDLESLRTGVRCALENESVFSALARKRSASLAAEVVLLKELQREVYLASLTTPRVRMALDLRAAEDGGMRHVPYSFASFDAEAIGARRARGGAIRPNAIGPLLHPTLAFDPKRSSSSVVLKANNRRAVQRQSKSWGSCICTLPMRPDTGTYTWVVQLETCEKGHVFVGVCTADASTNTYVGGDKHGWGYIGTKALWHGKTKVRSDYGAGFSSGSQVRVVLDTDTGTLSLGDLDTEGTWGVAFGNLPKVELFPSVGLYQNLDSVTVSNLEHLPEGFGLSEGCGDASGIAVNRAGGSGPGGVESSPAAATAVLASHLRRHQCYVTFCEAVCASAERLFQNYGAEAMLHPFLRAVVPPALASMACLSSAAIPKAAVARLAAVLLPMACRLLDRFDALQRVQCEAGKETPPKLAGTWRINSAAADAIPAQMYYLSFEGAAAKHGKAETPGSFVGAGLGTTVNISGAILGSKVKFVEGWGPKSHCLIEGRLALDGNQFWGLYKDLRSTTSGTVVGTRVRRRDAPMHASDALWRADLSWRLNALVKLAAVAAGRLVTFIHGFSAPLLEEGRCALDNRNEFLSPASAPKTPRRLADDVKAWLSSALLGAGVDAAQMRSRVRASLRFYYGNSSRRSSLLSDLLKPVEDLVTETPPSPSFEDKQRDALEAFLKDVADGVNPAASRMEDLLDRIRTQSAVTHLGGPCMARARRQALAALLLHSGAAAHFVTPGGATEAAVDALGGVWSAVVKVLGWAVKERQDTGDSYADLSAGLGERALFLLALPARAMRATDALTSDLSFRDRAVREAVAFLTSRSLGASELASLRVALEHRAVRCALRVAPLRAFARLLPGPSHAGGDGRRSRAATCVLLQTMALMISGDAGAPLLSVAEMGALGGGVLSATPKGESGTGSEWRQYCRGHLLHGVDGAGESVERLCRDAYEALLDKMLSSFDEAASAMATSRASDAFDASVANVACAALGFFRAKVSGPDAGFLGAHDVFALLRRLTDESRRDEVALGVVSAELFGTDSPRSDALALSEAMHVLNRRRVVQGARTVLRYLALQLFSDHWRASAAPPVRGTGESPIPAAAMDDSDRLSRQFMDSLYSQLAELMLEVEKPPLRPLLAWEPSLEALKAARSRGDVEAAAGARTSGTATSIRPVERLSESEASEVKAALDAVEDGATGPGLPGQPTSHLLAASFVGSIPARINAFGFSSTVMVPAENEKHEGRAAAGAASVEASVVDTSARAATVGWRALRRFLLANPDRPRSTPSFLDSPAVLESPEAEAQERIHGLERSFLICSDFLSLLLTLAESERARIQLATPAWAALLFRGALVRFPAVARSCLRLLGRVLPLLEPEELRDLAPSGTAALDGDEDAARVHPTVRLLLRLITATEVVSPAALAWVLADCPAGSDSWQIPTGAEPQQGDWVRSQDLASYVSVEGLGVLRRMQEEPRWQASLREAMDELLGAYWLRPQPLSSAPGCGGASQDSWLQERRRMLMMAALLQSLGGGAAPLLIGSSVVYKTQVNADGVQTSVPHEGLVLRIEDGGRSESCTSAALAGGTATVLPSTNWYAHSFVRAHRVALDDLRVPALPPAPRHAVGPELLTAMARAALHMTVPWAEATGQELARLARALRAAQGGSPEDPEAIATIEDATDASGDAEITMQRAKEADGEAASARSGAMPDEEDEGKCEDEGEGEGEAFAGQGASFEASVWRAALAVKAMDAMRNVVARDGFFASDAPTFHSLVHLAAQASEGEALNSVATAERRWFRVWQDFQFLAQTQAVQMLHPTRKGDAPSLSDDLRGSDDTDGPDGDGSFAGAMGFGSSHNTAPGRAAQEGPNNTVAIMQMVEMGFPQIMCEAALRRCGGSVEAAISFCFEHGEDMDAIVAEEQALQAYDQAQRASGRPRDPNQGPEPNLRVNQLAEMGFPPHWCRRALRETGNNVDAALTWILGNGEALAAEDVQGSDAKADEAGTAESSGPGREDSGAQMAEPGPDPLVTIGGEASISDGFVEGTNNSGFATVGARGCPARSGQWYYEITLLSDGCMQLGWADVMFSGVRNQTDDGVGDGPESWAYDGWRQYKWHDVMAEWGARWKAGDVVGLGVDLGAAAENQCRSLWFTLNGRAEEVGCGVAFEEFTLNGGLYPAVSLSFREKVIVNLGHRPFKHAPPAGYAPFLDLVRERAALRDASLERLRTPAAGAAPASTSSEEGWALLAEGVVEEDCLEECAHALSLGSASRFFDADAPRLGSARGLRDLWMSGPGPGKRVLRSRRGIGSASSGVGDGAAAAGEQRAANNAQAGIDGMPAGLSDAHDDDVRPELRPEVAALAQLLGFTLGKPSAANDEDGPGAFVPWLGGTSSADVNADAGASVVALAKTLLGVLRSARHLCILYARDALFRCMAASADPCRGTGLPLLGPMLASLTPVDLARSAADGQTTIRGRTGTAYAGALLSAYAVKSRSCLEADFDQAAANEALQKLCATCDVGPHGGHPQQRFSEAFLEESLYQGGAAALDVLSPAFVSAIKLEDAGPRIGLGPLRRVIAQALAFHLRCAASRRYCMHWSFSAATGMVSTSEHAEAPNRAARRAAGFARGLVDAALLEESEMPSNLHPATRTPGLHSADADGTPRTGEGNGATASPGRSAAAPPNLELAQWCSSLLLACQSTCACEDTLEVYGLLVDAWLVALRAPSAPLTYLASLNLAAISRDLADTMRTAPASRGTGETADALLRRLDPRRVECLVEKVQRDQEQTLPVASFLLQGLYELLTGLRVLEAALRPHGASMAAVDAVKDGFNPGDGGWTVWVGTATQSAFPFPAVWEPEEKGDDGPPSSSSLFGEAMGLGPSSSRRRNRSQGGEPPLCEPGTKVMRGPQWKFGDQDRSPLRENDEDHYVSDGVEEGNGPTAKPAANGEADVVAVEPPSTGSASENSSAAVTSSVMDLLQRKSAGSEAKGSRALLKPVVGEVLDIVEWDGVPGGGRRVRWPHGATHVYRFGAHGAYDVVAVETRSAGRSPKGLPWPETARAAAIRAGFGSNFSFGVILRLRPSDGAARQNSAAVSGETRFEGYMELPDYRAVLAVDAAWGDEGRLLVRETQFMRGNRDAGWASRFGTMRWIPGTTYELRPRGDLAPETRSSSVNASGTPPLDNRRHLGPFGGNCDDVSELRGTFSASAEFEGRAQPVGGRLWLTQKHNFRFDPRAAHPSVVISAAGLYASSGRGEDCRCLAYGNVGWGSGVHYWELKIEEAQLGTVFLGVAEKAPPGAMGDAGPGASAAMPRLSHWQGWGFVSYRATYHAGNERVYGEHFNAGDTVGVRLDVERETLSFFLDGLKFGEHVLTGLGPAYRGLDKGKAADTALARVFWPVVGFRRKGDRVTLNGKWCSHFSPQRQQQVRDVVQTSFLLARLGRASTPAAAAPLPSFAVAEACRFYERWSSGRWTSVRNRWNPETRLVLDRHPLSCLIASARLGLDMPLFSGDLVLVTTSGGRPLEEPEKARVLGTYRQRLWYRLETQRAEAGGSPFEGDLAWYWEPFDVPGLILQKRAPGVPEMLQPGHGAPELPRIDACAACKVCVVGKSGVAVRDSLELDGGEVKIIMPRGHTTFALQRRVNASNVARLQVQFRGVLGWVSEMSRGVTHEDLLTKRIWDGVDGCDLEERPGRSPLPAAPQEAQPLPMPEMAHSLADSSTNAEVASSAANEREEEIDHAFAELLASAQQATHANLSSALLGMRFPQDLGSSQDEGDTNFESGNDEDMPNDDFPDEDDDMDEGEDEDEHDEDGDDDHDDLDDEDSDEDEGLDQVYDPYNPYTTHEDREDDARNTDRGSQATSESEPRAERQIDEEEVETVRKQSLPSPPEEAFEVAASSAPCRRYDGGVARSVVLFCRAVAEAGGWDALPDPGNATTVEELWERAFRCSEVPATVEGDLVRLGPQLDRELPAWLEAVAEQTAAERGQPAFALLRRVFCRVAGVSDATDVAYAETLGEAWDATTAEDLAVRLETFPQTHARLQGGGDAAVAEVLARCAFLLLLNERVARALPFLSIRKPDAVLYPTAHGRASAAVAAAVTRGSAHAWAGASAAPLAGKHGPIVVLHGKPAGQARLDVPVWVPQSVSQDLLRLRGVLLTSVKRDFWQRLLGATTSPTTLNHDEYDDPKDIRKIKVNRVKATPQRLGAIESVWERVRRSVFGQLHKELRSWSDACLRRSYVGKGHGGQRRCFTVNFIGEGVNDYGGPYRAVFEQVAEELQHDIAKEAAGDSEMPRSRASRRRTVSDLDMEDGQEDHLTTLDDRGAQELSDGLSSCLLPLFLPCPNRTAGVGGGEDAFVLQPSETASPHLRDLAQFLGKLMGVANRHGLKMNLDLSQQIWRILTAMPVGRDTLVEVDLLTTNRLETIENLLGDGGRDGAAAALLPDWDAFSMSTNLSDGSVVPVDVGAGDEDLAERHLRPETARAFVRQVETLRLTEGRSLLAAMLDGLGRVVPVEVLSLFSPREAQELLCGRREIDVELLQAVAEYEGVVTKDDPHILWFWEVLRELSSEQRVQFLKFAWARSRMPSSAQAFPMPFKIQAPSGEASVHPDAFLPSAHTCFFSLTLPRYTHKAVLRTKLLYAIGNSPTMDADVRLHSAEGWTDM